MAILREMPESKPKPKQENPLQHLLTESTADELTRQLADPFRLTRIDLADLVCRGVVILSNMAAELGVVLRVKVRVEGTGVQVDEEKIRRAVNALVIHLLTVSQAEGWVTIGVEDYALDGRHGYLLLLTADRVILPWKTNPECEEELKKQAELSLCRQIIEKHGGILAVRFNDDNTLTYSVWLPA